MGNKMPDSLLTSLPAIARQVHKNAVRKGFWDSALTRAGVYAEEFIPEKLALIHSEVSEALEKYRDNPGVKITDIDGFSEELADIIIRTMDLAEAYGFDINEEIIAKHVKNLGREHMHGGKRC